MPKREEGSPWRQEDEEGVPPEQRALLVHGMHGRGGTHNQTNSPRGPPEHRAPPAHGMQGRGGESGARPQPKGEGGPPPDQPLTPFVRVLIQEMGGNPQDMQSPPPNAR